jgi:iron complex outermembrane receptor protein
MNNVHMRSVVAFAAVAACAACSAQGDKSPGQLGNLTIEDLMSLPVVSSGKKPEVLSMVPNATSVITSEDIRRSTATTVPDLLRFVPGVHVAQIDGNKWMVSVRGFNNRFSNKLLVLIDGQSVYSHLFAGVIWDEMLPRLDEIERIEVVRGPGGTLWGANAVNGVINIITKRSGLTQGSFLSLRAGAHESGEASFRYGGVAGANATFRLFGSAFRRSGLEDAAGVDRADDWEAAFGGLRADWTAGERDAFFLNASAMSQTLGQVSTVPTLTPPYSAARTDRMPLRVWSANLGWNRHHPSGADTTAYVHARGTDRRAVELAEHRTTLGIDLQHTQGRGGKHQLMVGLSHYRTSDSTEDSPFASFDPLGRTIDRTGLFVQDEIVLRQDLRLTVGAKLEGGFHADGNFQPNIRLLHSPDPRRSYWASVSRALRSVTRSDHDGRADLSVIELSGMPAVFRVLGNEDATSEEVIALEAGFRNQASERLGFDVAAFFNEYRNLRSYEQGTPFLETDPMPPHLVIPLVFGNKLSAKTYGVEASAVLKPSDSWQLNLGYSLFVNEFKLDEDSLDPLGPNTAERAGSAPRHTAYLKTSHRLCDGLELDVFGRYVDALSSGVPAYVTGDIRLGWRTAHGWDVDLVVRDIFTPRHREAPKSFFEVPGYVPRTAVLRVTWRF